MTARRARWAFVGILAVFVLPLALAWLMYSGFIGSGPAATDNEGRLVIPPRPLDWSDTGVVFPVTDAAPLEGAWVILYPVLGSCPPACRQRIAELGQVHRATGRHADRVRVAVLLTYSDSGELGETIRELNPGAYRLQNAGETFSSALLEAGEGAPHPSVYLVDPLGNIMMIYEEEDGMGALLRDLEKLLARSKTGAGQ